MKKPILISIILTAVWISLYAQPMAFKYSAVAVDAEGNSVTGEIGVRLTLHEDAEDGPAKYMEYHTVTASEMGKFSLNVGRGTSSPELELFENLDWGNHQYWMQVALSFDFDNYEIYGVSQLLSVPYALYAAKAGGTSADDDSDKTNELQVLSLSGDTLRLSREGGVIILPPEIDGDPTNEIQELSLNGSALRLSREGGEINLPPEEDGDPTNELQELSLENGAIKLSHEGGQVTLPTEVDGDPTNEIQELSLNGSALRLSREGGEINLPPEVDGDPTNELQELSLENGAIKLSHEGGQVILPTEVDGDITNELQKLSLDGRTLKLSREGGEITLPKDSLVLENNQLSLLNGNTIDLPDAITEINGGTGIDITPSGSTVTVTAQTEDAIWNAYRIKGRKIGGMEPNNKARFFYYDPDSTQFYYSNENTDVEIKEDGQVQVYGLKGRKIGGMEPNNKARFFYYDPDQQQYDYSSDNDDLEIKEGGQVQVYGLKGRKIGGMEPNNKARFFYYDPDQQQYDYSSEDDDLEIKEGGQVQVYGLKGRKIGGMEPNNKARFFYYDPDQQQYDYSSDDDDLEIKEGGQVQVYGLKGRKIGGMEPNNKARFFYYDPARQEYDYSSENDDLEISETGAVEIKSLQGVQLDFSSGTSEGTVLTFTSNSRIEARDALTLPLEKTVNLGIPMLDLTNTNSSESHLSGILVENRGRYGVRAISKEEQGTFSLSQVTRSFTYPAALFGEHKGNNGQVGGLGVLGKAVPNSNNFGIGGMFLGNSIGVLGIAFSTGNGVVGIGNHGARAGFFNGNVLMTSALEVHGSLDSDAKNLKIDHPQDPANKFLYHTSIESPDMKNVYDGIATTDAEGFATVELPGYMMSLNKDFRYQLTCIGVFAQAIIFEKIENNRFIIQTDQPNVEVSWQVTGIRKDPYAETHRTVPEVEKAPEEKGKYLHPELYGQPKEKKIGWQDFN